MITLSKLLEAADPLPHNAGAGISSVLGDRYLYANNPIFRDVRDKALLFGYSYSDKDCPLWRDYQVFALVTLPVILRSRTIPFMDNATVISRLVADNGSLTVPPHFLLTALKKNYLLHESGHVVSNVLLQNRGSSFGGDWTESESFALQSLLCESFANTIEKLASAVAHESLHALLFTLNSYILFSRKHIEHLRAALHISGARTVFMIGFLLFYASNTSGDGFDEAARDWIISKLVENGYGFGREEIEASYEHLLQAGVNVNPDFREETTPLYFEMCGHADIARSKFQNLSITNNEKNLALVFRAAQLFAAAEESAFKELDDLTRTIQ